ncbi:unnamed protein product [Spirodela intermedia]|uniref:Uncharacterized protein n=1 Tax=Spirodela intermedia TaxID=51605 RepID=A0A7I8J366_SPIIN|nr:unnamed protein product [Spirodela intermedia]CAA6664547.1 unnamed protein product [Spirodela intermedia]
MAPGNFQGRVSIGARDYRSIYIRFELEADYRRAWSRPTWRMGSLPSIPTDGHHKMT